MKQLSPLTRLGIGIITVIAVRTLFVLLASGMNVGYAGRMALTAIVSFAIPAGIFYAVFRMCESNESVGTEEAHGKVQSKPELYRALYFVPILFFWAGAGGLLTEIIAGVLGVSVDQNVYEPIMPQDTFEAAIFFIMTALAAPIAEELIFREIIFAPLRKFGDYSAVAVSSICFALFHGNLSQLLYAFFCGMLLGRARVLFGTVKAPVIIHMLYNTTVMILYSADIDAAALVSSLLALIGAGLTVFMFSKPEMRIAKPIHGRKMTALWVVKNPLLMLGLALLLFYCF